MDTSGGSAATVPTSWSTCTRSGSEWGARTSNGDGNRLGRSGSPDRGLKGPGSAWVSSSEPFQAGLGFGGLGDDETKLRPGGRCEAQC